MILLENRFWFAVSFQVTHLITVDHTDSTEAAVVLSY